MLEMAPAAMLSHLEIATDLNDFHHSPVVLPCQECMDYSWSFFEASIKETYDMPNSPFLPCKAITNHGMLSFCEATKVDLQSWYNSKKKIWNQTHESSITSTISLVSCMFEDLQKDPSQKRMLSFGIKENPRRKNTSYASLKDTIPPPK